MSSLMLNFSDLLVAYLAYVIATASPGPANLAIMTTAMHQGRKSGLYLALGVVCGSLCWAILAALGLSALLSAFGWAFTVIKVVGGLYLLWLAFKAARAALRKTDIATAPIMADQKSGSAYFLKGFLIHMTNPKAVFAWVAIISLGLKPDAPAWMSIAVVGGCAILGVFVFGSYALAFSTPTMINLYASFKRSIEGVMAVAFGLAGIKLLTSRL
ncbi:MAG: LysE family translocator [Sneathiella sp.]|nr:LysE family translocator [Sneathiella sp.]